MPDQRLQKLCKQISQESHPAKAIALLDDLIKLLVEEQEIIKAKLRARPRADKTGT